MFKLKITMIILLILLFDAQFVKTETIALAHAI